MKLRDIKTIKERKRFIENTLKIKLDAISQYPKDLEAAQNKNCENMIGAVSIPLGVAGPLKINGNYAKSEAFYIPLATTEAALVASVNRGCKALTASGGVTAVCEDVGITRGAVFETEGIKQSHEFKNWLFQNKQKIAAVAEKISSHLKFLNLKVKIVNKLVFVRFSFDTMEAMGMNLATYATDSIAGFIKGETGTICVSIAGNFDNDKKPSYLNLSEGRGRSVSAECLLPEKIVKDVLKTTPLEIDKVVRAKIYLGSMVSGSLAFNAHFANILSAIFLASGQDVAHIAEGSIGITSTEIIKGDLYISVFLPDVPLGTVGGGTALPSQQEALKILQVTGGQKGEQSRKLSEIIASSVLAGELSLLSALSKGELASAHKRFTKNI